MRPAAIMAQDWTPAKLSFELKLAGLSFRSLGQLHGYSANSLWRVCRVSWPKAEKLVAEALGLAVNDIWPSRIRARRERAARRKGASA